MLKQCLWAIALALTMAGPPAAWAQAEALPPRPSWLSPEREQDLTTPGSAMAMTKAWAPLPKLRNLAVDVDAAGLSEDREKLAALVSCAYEIQDRKFDSLYGLEPGNDAELLRLHTLILNAFVAGQMATAARQTAAYNERYGQRLLETGQQTFANLQRLTKHWLVAGELAKCPGNVQAASGYLARGADALPESALELRLALLDHQFRMLSAWRDPKALEQVRQVLESRLLPLLPRERFPEIWAERQAALGKVLSTLAENQRGQAEIETLTASRLAYERAAEGANRAADPASWAEMQFNVGWVAERLGGLQSGPAALESYAAARAAYERSLEVYTRSGKPESWAIVQLRLGIVAWRSGALVGGKASYERAAQHLRAALEETKDPRTRESISKAIPDLESKLATAAP